LSGAALIACQDDESGLFDPVNDGLAFPEGVSTGGTSSLRPIVVGGADAEVEKEASFYAPVVSGKYLWSVNPDTNKVVRVHAESLAIDLMQGGHEPTYLAVLPEGATPGGAVVLNVRSGDASIFLRGSSPEELLPVQNFAVQEGASSWAIGKGGKFAIAWSDAREKLLDRLDGYQDITVFSFGGESITTKSLSVGFRPNQVVISQDETRAYVVSQPGISIIALSESPEIEGEIFLPDLAEGARRDVSITPDGKYALVSTSGSAKILVVDLKTEKTVSLNMPSIVTDLDLSKDGSVAVAVSRPITSASDNLGGASAMEDAQSVIGLLPIDKIFDDPSSFELVYTDEFVGSTVVADDGSQILLFTNGIKSSLLLILETETKKFRSLDLRGPLQAAFISQDARFAVALMSPPSGSTKKGAFALIPLEKDASARIQGTDAPLQFVSISASTGHALITTRATTESQGATYFTNYPKQQVDKIVLPSTPLSTGIVPQAKKAFISQQHPEGRLTFIDLPSGEDETLTGFELSGRVVQ